jgi:hypothetical protein
MPYQKFITYVMRMGPDALSSLQHLFLNWFQTFKFKTFTKLFVVSEYTKQLYHGILLKRVSQSKIMRLSQKPTDILLSLSKYPIV